MIFDDLRAIQLRYGFLPKAELEALSQRSRTPLYQIHGVASFYRDFRTSPTGATTVRICRAEACQSVGARDLEASAERELGLKIGETSADESITLDEVFCLGNCALGPAVQINGVLHGRVSSEQLPSLIAAAVTK